MAVASDKQTHLTNPSLVPSHLRCGSSSEWGQSPSTRTTHGSFRTVATLAVQWCLPSSHGYSSVLLLNTLQGCFDGNEEREPTVHVVGVTLRLDRHDNMIRQLGVTKRQAHTIAEKNPENP